MRSRKWPSKSKLVLLGLFLLVLEGQLALAVQPQAEMSGAKPKERYTVQLGTFKTVPPLADLYLQVPEKYHDKTMVCHSAIHYTLRCGASIKKDAINPIFKEFNDLGLKPIIVKADLRNCTPADEFFKSYGRKRPHAAWKKKKKSVSKQPPAYADLLDPAVRRYLERGEVSILPEITTKVYLSNRDVNRITCMGGRPIKDIVYSKEKGISVKTDESNAFVKFLISRDSLSGALEYANVPSEFYVVCGEDTVYTLIAMPRNIPAQAIELVSRKKDIEKNLSIFEGLSFERKVLMLVKDTYRDTIPESFTVQYVNKPFNIFRDIDIVLKRRIVADGEGLQVKEFVLGIKSTSTKNEIHLREKFFLLPELTRNPVGISLEHMTLKKGRPSRLFIVERHVE